MANNKALKNLTVAVTIALLVCVTALLLSFLLVKPVPVSAEMPYFTHSVSVGK
jgi:hypothetical protein